VDMRLYPLFAECFEYPTLFLSDRVNECISILKPLQREAADLMRGLKVFLHQTSLGRMVKVYTHTFDFNGLPILWKKKCSKKGL
jgi:nitrate reductase delta subunit